MAREFYYMGDRRALTRLHTGSPFFVDTSDIGISTWLVMLGQWEAFVEKNFARYVARAESFIDCGANMGYYTVIARHYSPSIKRIYSFEPNPRLFQFLRDNIAINGMDGVSHLHDLACGNRFGEVLLAVEPRLSGGGTVVNVPLVDREIHRVKGDTLDNIVPVRDIDLIKIDVEGNEPAVIEGARDIIDHSPNLTMIIELSPMEWASRGWNPVGVLDELKMKGFQLKIIDGGGNCLPLEPSNVFEAAASFPFVTCMIATRHPV